MPVLAPLKPLFDAIAAAQPSIGQGDPAQARAETHAVMEANVLGFYAPREPTASEADHSVPVAGGRITVRVYAPSLVSDRPLPCHVYFHGGSFWLGTLDHFDPICRGLAEDVGCVVVSVGYRLAPEHQFPTAPEDCFAALCWVVEHATQLGVDPTRVSAGGVSAGGNLAAVVALMARDRGGPSLVLQVLEIPITDLATLEPLNLPAEGVTLPSGKEVVLRYYLSAPSDANNPYASPLCASDLRSLPPALVMCAEYDPLAAEGAAYARRLAAAEVPVDYRCWSGQFHGSQPMAALIPKEAAEYQAQVVRALRLAYGADG